MGSRKTGKRLLITPNSINSAMKLTNAKMEKNRLPVPDVDLNADMTFYGNRPREAVQMGYDQYFSYTKVFPLFDQRKPVENRGYMPDSWENIHDQEKPPKAVPSTTSQWYGRRPGYDPDILKFGRHCQTKTFYTKHGAIDSGPRMKYSEEFEPSRL